jgi:NAD(P)-dependent dehydrogenase (short-subunit alcohol dehydrogenase family)
MKNLENKVALVTGGASGIGEATAQALAGVGCRVIIADINEEGGRRVAASIGDDRAFAIHCDVGAPDAFDAAKEATLEKFGRIDIVMNNAGILTSGRPEDLPVEEWQRVLDVNLMSVVRSNAVFLPIFLEQGSGHIVNTASFSGLYTYAYDRLPYAAAKAALIQLSEGLALYLRPQGIGVTCLCPGPVKTNIMSSTRTFSEGLDIRGPGAQFSLLEAEEVGRMVVDAIRNDTFMLPTDHQVRELLVERASDWDGFLQRQIDSPHIIVPGKRR